MKDDSQDLYNKFAAHHASKPIKIIISNAKRLGNDEAVQIGEARLKQLFEDERSGKSPVYNDLMKQVEAYEAVLTEAANSKRTARYSRRKIENVGAVQMLKDLLAKNPDTAGLNKLRETGNLQAAYEQVVINNQEYFSPKEIAEAKKRLGLP